MFYPVTSINELMPDALIHSLEPSNQPSYINEIGYFNKFTLRVTNAEQDKSSKLVSPSGDKAVKIKEVWETYDGSRGTLPDSVLCHPSIGYATKYGNVMLSGLNNNMGNEPVEKV